MKHFQQNLLIILAVALCGLCAWQWRSQSVQRNEIEKLNQLVYDKSVAIRDDTNSIATLNDRVTQLDASLTELRATAKKNAETIADRNRELERLQAVNEGITNELAQYRDAVGSLTNKLAEAYAGIEKQNAAIKELTTQRKELVKKYNDEANDRNNVVSNYNALVEQVKKFQGGK